MASSKEINESTQLVTVVRDDIPQTFEETPPPTKNRGFRIFMKCLEKGPTFYSRLGGTVTVAFLLLTLWLLCFSVSGLKMMIESEIFAVLALLSTALAGGRVVKIIKLPALFGFMVVGLMWRNWNVTPIDLSTQISAKWGSIFRNMASVIILLRGGYGLNYTVLKSSYSVILRLSFLPCLLEATATAISVYLLLGYSWIWGFLIGFMLSAVSPAVVIPSMLRFKEEGYGIDKGVTTVAIGATGFDNVLAMVGFGIIQSFIFSPGNLLQNLGNIPLQLVVGAAFGIGWGLLLHCCPCSNLRPGHIVGARFFLLMAGGVIANFAGRALNFSGAGPLACVIMAFIANVSWSHQSGWGKPQNPNPIADLLSGLWIFQEGILFGLIGTQILIEELDLTLVGYGALVMAISLVVRVTTTFFAVMNRNFTRKDRLFLALSWIPKATVQAALGPVVLESARRLESGEEYEKMGMNIITLAAMSILIMAPLGAVAIELSGPRLLKKSVVDRSV